MTMSKCAATAVAALALLAGAEHAAAQMVEPQRAPESVVAPPDAASVDTGLVGAAPVPEQPGPLGEPAPPAVLGEITLEVTDAAAATLDSTDADSPLGTVLLGDPVPTPTRRSFLPAIRTADRSAPVPVSGSGAGLTGQAFLDEQLTHRRVVDAQLDAKFELKALFAERGLSYPSSAIFFRLFKQEQVLEVWVADAANGGAYTLLREYPICAIPGRLGPKTRNDDFQAPEGFYYIEGFNPESDFHLSLRLNYPNPADRVIGVDNSWGGDIYIHGGCSTVGCFPMTDEAMAELYWLAVEARAAGQTVIPVHVFPARMNDQGMRFLRRTFERDTRLVAFWENLREGYEFFESQRRVPAVTVDPAGRYLFASAAPTQEAPSAEVAADAPGLLGEEVARAGEPPAGSPSAEPPAGEAATAEPTAEPASDPAPPLEVGTVDAPLGAELPAATSPAAAEPAVSPTP